MNNETRKALLVKLSESFNESASPTFSDFLKDVAASMREYSYKNETVEIIDQPDTTSGYILATWALKDDYIYQADIVWRNVTFCINIQNVKYELEIDKERLEFDLPAIEQTLS